MSIVVIGAGHAAGALAGALRQAGDETPILLIGDEAVPPYQRPPLSKAWLKPEAAVEVEDLLVRPASWYAENGVTLALGQRVVGVDRAAQQVLTAAGTRIDYESLVFACGASPRLLGLGEDQLVNAHYLRTVEDADRLRANLETPGRLVVVGAGYVGLEAAASAREMGWEVVVLERAEQVLARVASPPLGRFVRDLHDRKGVQFELGAGVVALTSSAGRFTGLELQDGRRLDGDLLLIGVGAAPNEDLARQAGLACADGIVVDGDGRTIDPRAFAIGDVARRPARCGVLTRLESVPSAVEQARIVAAAIAGAPRPSLETPWFWSDQYEVKLQMAGHPAGGAVHVVRGSPEAGFFSVFHLVDGVVRGVEAVNAPGDFMAGRLMIARSKRVDAVALADPAASLKALAA